MIYDRDTRSYVCPGCGLTYTTQDLVIESKRSLDEKFREDKRRKKYAEYLEWWTSSKK
ncbi:MAG: hypothetical protein J7L79_05015 [Thaumarchaeota archaeon]|nr:hypothetical protein [Nitrososphaerota archaeon]